MKSREIRLKVSCWLVYLILCFLEMVFDEDLILLSFFDRYQMPDEIEDLKADVLKYIGAGAGQKVQTQEPVATGDDLAAVSNLIYYKLTLINSIDVVTNGFCS